MFPIGGAVHFTLVTLYLDHEKCTGKAVHTDSMRYDQNWYRFSKVIKKASSSSGTRRVGSQPEGAQERINEIQVRFVVVYDMVLLILYTYSMYTPAPHAFLNADFIVQDTNFSICMLHLYH
jgi:hypothetical protein